MTNVCFECIFNCGEIMNTHVVGVKGEELAKKYLQRHHYKILEQNYATKLGEIDIIAYKQKTYIFVEVKARQDTRFGLPREAVTPYKQNKIKRVAEYYLLENNLLQKPFRFDCIEVLDGKINHIENAF